MGDSHVRLQYHLVFSTKQRTPWLTKDLVDEVGEYVRGILRRRRMRLIVFGGAADHVHFLIMAHASYAPADIVRTIKSNTGRWLNHSERFHGGFAWQAGYAIFSVSASVAASVVRYIRDHDHAW